MGRAAGIRITSKVEGEASQILTPQALQFLAALHQKFEPVRYQLLEKRKIRQAELDKGALPDFLPETQKIRSGDWKVAPIPADLTERKVEITGPVDRKMIINAFNSGADVFMADFEDSHCPTWDNTIQGQINLRDAINRKIGFTTPEGRLYDLAEDIATLMVRPRGWHLNEKHAIVDNKEMSGSLFDFGLFFFHNAHALIKNGSGPYFYLPKMESHLEARLWNDVFCFAQNQLGIPQGTIRATVLIETVLAAFEMDEILYELKEHSAGLNCGRWDYIFSFIKKFKSRKDFLLPDRSQITMDKAFLKAYVELLIKTCHKRGAHAMGGMAAQIPIKNDAKANEAALEKVRLDKLREVNAGHDGTWVAHPALVPIAKEIFNQHMTGPHQLHIKRQDVLISAQDLLARPQGEITEVGLRKNINVGILYLEAWLRGVGCVPLYNLMEDAATAEISRSQVWQWVHHQAKMTDGKTVTAELVKKIIAEETGEHKQAAALFEEMSLAAEFPEFLTLKAYEYIN